MPCLLPRAEVAIDMWDLDVEGVDSGHNEHHPTPYHTCYRRERVVVRCGARGARTANWLTRLTGGTHSTAAALPRPAREIAYSNLILPVLPSTAVQL